jgi:hypothetical protein
MAGTDASLATLTVLCAFDSNQILTIHLRNITLPFNWYWERWPGRDAAFKRLGAPERPREVSLRLPDLVIIVDANMLRVFCVNLCDQTFVSEDFLWGRWYQFHESRSFGGKVAFELKGMT